MSRADWSEAPEWANWWAVDKDGDAFFFSDKPELMEHDWILSGSLGNVTSAGDDTAENWRESLERRPTVSTCPQCGYALDDGDADDMRARGMCGTCVTALAGLPALDNVNSPDPQLSKQVRYRDSEGEDWIDEFARTATPEEFRGAMRFTIGKYVRRVGRKDAELAEVRKMRDYCQRWEQYLMHNEGEDK